MTDLIGLLREWQRMYNRMNSTDEGKHPTIAEFRLLDQRTHQALAAPPQPGSQRCFWCPADVHPPQLQKNPMQLKQPIIVGAAGLRQLLATAAGDPSVSPANAPEYWGVPGWQIDGVHGVWTLEDEDPFMPDWPSLGLPPQANPKLGVRVNLGGGAAAEIHCVITGETSLCGRSTWCWWVLRRPD